MLPAFFFVAQSPSLHKPLPSQSDGSLHTGTKSGPRPMPAEDKGPCMAFRQLRTNKGAAVTLQLAGHLCKADAAWAGGFYLRLSNGNPNHALIGTEPLVDSGNAASFSLPIQALISSTTGES